jgi:dihydropteroate synthase
MPKADKHPVSQPQIPRPVPSQIMHGQGHDRHYWLLPGGGISIGQWPLVMGILNVTPDSFSDGGRYNDSNAAVARGMELIGQGADILDIGGESTRPGAEPVTAEEELRRVLPVVRALAKHTSASLSVDTSKALVAQACLAEGACIINDVTAMAGDPRMAAVVAESQAGVILMHMQGSPATMQGDPRYADVVADVANFFAERLNVAEAAGIRSEQVVLDPGIGFGKTVEHNCLLLRHLAEFGRFGRPLCVGVSRKGVVSALLSGRTVDRRLAGSLALVSYLAERFAAQVVRVHDVQETKDVLTMLAALA